MKFLCIGLIASLWILGRTLAAADVTSGVQQPSSQPNILLILSDDHSVPHLGCLGDKAARTPNLDRFASQGMLFDKQFCVAPQCVPSRAGFVTGRSAVAARITRFSSPLPADVPALPDLLRAHGYFSGICRRTFHLDGTGGGGVTGQIYKSHPELRTFSNRVDFLDVNSPREKTVEVVNKFLDKVPARKPFFLWVSFNEPHHPWDRPAPGAPTDPAKVTVPAYLPDIPEIRRDLARYYDEVAAMDEEFQWVMDILDKRDVANNTMVVFLGDNGYAFPHGKGSLYDPGLNTPLIVRWPGKVKAAARTSELIFGEDIAPTLLEAAGALNPKGMTGQSFLKLLTGEKFEGRKFIFAERGPHGGATFNEHTKSAAFDQSRCVRSDQFKLIYNCSPHQIYQPVDSSGDPYWKAMVTLHDEDKLAPRFVRTYFTTPRPVLELYDLERDPGELNNLAGKREYAKIEHELKAALQEKMILDYDYLPLPIDDKVEARKTAAKPRVRNNPAGN
jgi:N-sulfoglucosamine sulfohydrolase